MKGPGGCWESSERWEATAVKSGPKSSTGTSAARPSEGHPNPWGSCWGRLQSRTTNSRCWSLSGNRGPDCWDLPSPYQLSVGSSGSRKKEEAWSTEDMLSTPVSRNSFLVPNNMQGKKFFEKDKRMFRGQAFWLAGRLKVHLKTAARKRWLRPLPFTSWQAGGHIAEFPVLEFRV